MGPWADRWLNCGDMRACFPSLRTLDLSALRNPKTIPSSLVPQGNSIASIFGQYSPLTRSYAATVPCYVLLSIVEISYWPVELNTVVERLEAPISCAAEIPSRDVFPSLCTQQPACFEPWRLRIPTPPSSLSLSVYDQRAPLLARQDAIASWPRQRLSRLSWHSKDVDPSTNASVSPS